MDVVQRGRRRSSCATSITVHHRQADIQQDHFRRERVRHSQRRRTIVRQPRRVAQSRHQDPEHLGRIDVVVDDLDAQRPDDAPGRAFCFVRTARAAVVIGEPHLDFRPLADAAAAHFDPAIVHFNQPVRQRETDAQPAGRSLENVSFLVKHLEQMRQRIRRNANPGIAHADHRLTVTDLRGKGDPAAARRELHGVVQDVREYLDEASSNRAACSASSALAARNCPLTSCSSCARAKISDAILSACS